MSSTYYPTVKAARILYDSDRSSASASDDAAVVGWVKTNKLILAISIAYGSKATTASTFKLQWKNVTDAGSYADVAATGEAKYAATSSVLSNGNAVTSTEKRNTYTGGYTWQDGEESVNDNITGSISLASSYYTELQFALDLADAHDGDQYKFQLYNVTTGTSAGECACTVNVYKLYTLVVDAGSITTTGTTVTLSKIIVLRTLSADTGVYTTVGSTLIFLRSLALLANPPPLGYSCAGSDAALLTSKFITAVAGSYSHSGASVTLDFTRAIQANSSSYSTSGSQLSLLYNRIFVSSSGSYSHSGSDGSLLMSSICSAVAGSYLTTGSPVNLTDLTVRGWKSIGSLWFEPEGKAASLITLTAESGSYQFNGSELSLFVNHVLSSSSGAYTYNGVSIDLGSLATLLHDRIIDASAGIYYITGSDVAFETVG